MLIRCRMSGIVVSFLVLLSGSFVWIFCLDLSSGSFDGSGADEDVGRMRGVARARRACIDRHRRQRGQGGEEDAGPQRGPEPGGDSSWIAEGAVGGEGSPGDRDGEDGAQALR